MTDFEIRLPYRSRSDPLDVDALNAAAALEGDDRWIAEAVIWGG
jgi:hypothetical protein